ncbi:ChaN family lipoprotein [Pseudomonas nitroreducens]|uniref:ChaN family lipoprotein n=1 Tax=Pseudomonas nitroreducens TaxID=46680 RepID=UPI00265A92FF|nr:ChaN family lipoprotein [Pseudomonas nitroreducens]MCP1651999.1 putative iron-regulated protein [Pseudomonas nitroreducens]MCP1689482.1 putative iron-regulated protein [Pseudomonas nitroreducens]
MKKVLLVSLLALVAACQSPPATPPLSAWQSPEGRDNAELGVIRDLHSGEQLSPAQLLDRLASAPRVLVGEQHDNPDHHALELWLVRALAERRASGSVLLEMINPNQQEAVAAAQAAARNGHMPTDLISALQWQPGWSWSQYGPLLTWLIKQPAPLLAANLDRSEIMDIYRHKPELPGAASTASTVREALLEDIRASHCGLLPESQLPAMLAVQQQRDRRMAERFKAAAQPAVMIAGGFHARRDLGVPLHLQDLSAAQGLQVVMLAEVGKRVAPEQADYAWYTPAQPPTDYCAQMRGKM